MSGSRTKKVRNAFEILNGFNSGQRDLTAYKYNWRKWKKKLKRRYR